MNLLEKAIQIALEAHAGATDKTGLPYILHPLHLMMQMETEEEMITAVLHDVIEDSSVELCDLEAMGFPQSVLKALTLLTHDAAEAPYDEYVAAIRGNKLARRVKLADLAHNMDVRRLPALTKKDWDRLQQYYRAWAVLTSDQRGDA
ncbi:MAG: GTP pyrophosphokinase [Anaerolineae bacterium]